MKKKKSLAYRLFVRLPFWAIVISVALVTLLKWVPVWYTPVMLKHSVQYRKVEDYHTRQKWVPIERMSPALIQAVIASEDNLFWRLQHHLPAGRQECLHVRITDLGPESRRGLLDLPHRKDLGEATDYGSVPECGGNR